MFRGEEVALLGVDALLALASQHNFIHRIFRKGIACIIMI